MLLNLLWNPWLSLCYADFKKVSLGQETFTRCYSYKISINLNLEEKLDKLNFTKVFFGVSLCPLKFKKQLNLEEK